MLHIHRGALPKSTYRDEDPAWKATQPEAVSVVGDRMNQRADIDHPVRRLTVPWTYYRNTTAREALST